MAGRDLFAQAPESVGRNLFAQEEQIQPIPEVGTASQEQPYSGSILPFSRDEQGEISFDPNVGIVGMAKRAFTAPGEVLAGELDPRSEEGQRRATEAAAMMTPMGAAGRVGGSLFAPRGAFKTVTPKAPTREELQAATSAGYQKAADMGVEYTASGVKKLADDLQRSLDEEGFIAETAPEVHALLGKLQNPPEDATITLKSIDALRKRLGEYAGSPDKTKSSAASQAINSVDEFLMAADPANVVARTAAEGGGAARQAAETIAEARANAAAGFRSDRVTGLEQTAARRTAAAASGRNTDNAIRQRLTSFIESAKGSRGLNEEEKAAIDDVIFGRPSKNAARFFGNLLGGGGGLGTALLSGGAGVAGASALGPGGAAMAVIPPAIGAASRGVANRMSAKELKALDEMLRARSPLAASRGGPQQVYDPSAIPDSMLKALMFQSMQNQQPGNSLQPSGMQNALGAR